MLTRSNEIRGYRELHDNSFLSIQDAYDDSDVIFKWKNTDVHVSRDNMAQFQFMGASFTGKNQELFKSLNFRLYLLDLSCY